MLKQQINVRYVLDDFPLQRKQFPMKKRRIFEWERAPNRE